MKVSLEERPHLRCRANMAHIRQSRPDSGLGFQVEVPKTVSMCSLLAQKRTGRRWTGWKEREREIARARTIERARERDKESERERPGSDGRGGAGWDSLVARPRLCSTQGSSWGYFKSQFWTEFVTFWRQMPTKWLQERGDGWKRLEEHGVVQPPGTVWGLTPRGK